MQEIWKRIPDAPDYEISNTGRIMSYRNKTPREMTPSLGPDGYYSTSLRVGNKYISKRVHRWVAEAFIPNPNNLKTVNHIDANKKNNNVNNLEWSSQSDNVKHAINMGLHPWINKNRKSISGEDNVNAKLVLNEETGIYYGCIREAAEAHNIPRTTLNFMLLGRLKNKTHIVFV